jgi:NAD(P)-dependent dehydrogenase (short-subunit alcohol dehydrogenase family)
MSAKQIILEQYVKLPVLVEQDTCVGKTYIVTGSNIGLGLETARHLVGSSASTVILAVRNSAAGETAKAEIERTTGRKGVLEVWHLDLASSASVKKFASKAAKELDRIDGLIENAGVMLDTWTLAEGFETSMTVNVINTMFLGLLMLPQMIDSAEKYGIKPRIVFLVSGLGFTAGARQELAKAGKSDIFQGTNNQEEQDMNARYVESYRAHNSEY